MISTFLFLKNLTFSFRNSRKNLGKWVKWPEGVKKLCVELSWLLPPPWDLQKKWNNVLSPFIFPQKKCFLLLFALQQIFLLRGPTQHKMGGNNNTFFLFSRKSDRVQRSLEEGSRPLFSSSSFFSCGGLDCAAGRERQKTESGFPNSTNNKFFRMKTNGITYGYNAFQSTQTWKETTKL